MMDEAERPRVYVCARRVRDTCVCRDGGACVARGDGGPRAAREEKPARVLSVQSGPEDGRACACVLRDPRLESRTAIGNVLSFSPFLHGTAISSTQISPASLSLT